MLTSEFDFDLPADRIALAPAKPRDAARLLHITRDSFGDRRMRDLPALLNPGDLLAMNDTRVIPAQLKGVRPARTGSGENVELDVTLVQQLKDVDGAPRWNAFVRPAKRLAAGDRVEFGEGFSAVVEARSGAEARLAFECDRATFEAALARIGRPPLPPYIARKRAATEQDLDDYQTIYATEPGSVAAPTAGLHFTEPLFAALDARSVERLAVTLHVGPGTFLPVVVDAVNDHRMHAEWGEITAEQAARLNMARSEGRRIVAVGTTSLRLLESAADVTGRFHPFREETSIFITPGYRFRAVDALITNFHLPRSTLFMLVCAFAGTERMKRAYEHAIAQRYRFYSYGDGCLLERAI